ncbi:MAG: hypothetical protein HYZ53_12435 [Planctomycetes bacterium]|nr:hypothetical protein [Planctomycetota bacterium]
MSRVALFLATAAFVCGHVAVADAQSVKTGGRNDSAKSITISGEIDFPMVHRSESLNSVLDRTHAWDYDVNANGTLRSGDAEPASIIYQKDNIRNNAGGGTDIFPGLALTGSNVGAGPINSPADTLVNPLVRINFDVELAEKVSALVSLETKRLESDPFAGNGSNDVLATRQDWGTNANKSLVGDENIGVTIGQAYVKVSEFLIQQLSLKIGIQDLKYDLRGNGHAWFMDLRHSEYAFLSPTTENFGPEGSVYGYRAFNSGAHGAGIFRDEISSPGGAKITFNSEDTIIVDLFAMKTLSGRNFFGDFQDRGVLDKRLAAGDANRRGGTTEAHFDEDVYGLNVDYNIPDSKSMVNFITTAFAGDSGSATIWTVGLGGDYYLDSLELFGEVYGQWGTYGHIRGAVTSAAAVDNDFGDNVARTREATGGLHREEVEHQAWMVHSGAKYRFDLSCKPWVEVSSAWVGGDDGDVDDEEPDNHDFVSYENNNETLILEDSTFGLDVDSNYWKIALGVGVGLSLDHTDDFQASFTWTYAETVNDPDRVGRTKLLNRAAGAVVGGLADPDADSRLDLRDVDEELGHELDFRMNWNYSESLSFHLDAGFLLDPEFFKSRDTYRADGDMWLLSVGANLKF